MALRSYFMNERARLERLYRRALYRVELASGAVELAIGEGSAELDRELDRVGASSWAIVTACNPGSVPLGEEENRRRTAELGRRLSDAGWSTHPAAGLDPERRWPDEPGFLVVDAPTGVVLALAGELGQAAIVAGRRGGPAELVWVARWPQAPLPDER
jgi:hypothetical protein